MQREIPKGTIFAWSGSLADIPITFHLCDGARGTPDLRDKFVRGTTGAIAPGQTGGTKTHPHTFAADGHSHVTQLNTDIAFGFDFDSATTITAPTGTTNPNDGRPPWYALAYIMYLAVKR